MHNGYSKTDIGENDLSKAVIKYRIDNKINRGNVAVFEYIDNFGNIKLMFGESKGIFKPHAEKAVWNSLQEIGILPEQITKIYSELKPCMSPGRYCSNFINKTFPNAEVSYTFEYLNGTTDMCKESIKALNEYVKNLFIK
ncbi:nucleic acid/nucleotide deaminase domain-containing protein [Capnocytophaga cynodegmi]|uniref:nucleic acid/nucleotide deaminase domain-containing protein n=2 Tax=Capnocytophaga TaxID=1016 RepID=UPI0037D8D69B